MHLNDDISRIIAALDKGQKKYFIQYAKLFTTSKNNLYFKLYKLLEKQPDLTLKEQENALALSSNQQLRDIRRNLKEALLKCLRNYHENSWHQNETLDLYKNAKILHYLDLNDLAEKEVEKAINKQTQYDQVLLKHLHIYDSALNVWNQQNNPKSIVNKLKQFIATEEVVYEEYINYRFYYKILLEIELIKAQLIEETNHTTIALRIKQLIAQIEKKSKLNEKKPSLLLAKNYILSILYSMNGDVEKQLEQQRIYITTLDKLKPNNQDLDDAYKKISMCYLFAQAYSSLSNLEQLQNYASLLLTIFQKKEIEKNSWLWRKTLNFYIITQTQYLIKAKCNKSDIDEFIFIFSKYKQQIEKKDLLQYHIDDITLICLVCFYYEDYPHYIKFSQILLTTSTNEISPDAQFVFYLLEIMWNIQHKNWESVFSYLKKMHRILPPNTIENKMFYDIYGAVNYIYKNNASPSKMKIYLQENTLVNNTEIVDIVFNEWVIKNFIYKKSS